MKYAPKDAPLIGHGRWTWPLKALSDKNLLDTIGCIGLWAQREIKSEINTPINERRSSPQIIWNNLKEEIQRLTKKEHKNEKCRTKTKIKNLERDIKAITNRRGMDEDPHLREESAFLESELRHLHRVNAKDQKESTRAQIAHHGEKPRGI